MLNSDNPAALPRRRDQIRCELAATSDSRPGPLREKIMRCGKASCRRQRGCLLVDNSRIDLSAALHADSGVPSCRH